MSQYNSQKNPPWARSSDFGNVQQPSQPMMSQSINPAVLQYPQAAVSGNQPAIYQAQLAMQQQALSMQQFVANSTQQLYNSQVSGMNQNSRGVNPVAAMMPGNMMVAQQQSQMQQQQQQQAGSMSGGGGAPSKQRVFTGTVTKVVDSYGFVDEDVFFQMSCVKGPHPVLHDRVLVEAVCLPTMPFKWNATRVQVLPMSDSSNSRKRPASREDRTPYSAVPPPSDLEPRKERERDRDRDRRSNPKESEAEIEERLKRRRERREREEKERERERESRGRTRSRSPRRRALPVQRKYRVRIPECPLDVKFHNVGLVKSRYPQMYIPSDFFLATSRWCDTAPNVHPLSIAGPARFHVMDKEVNQVFQHSDVVDPPDADFLFSAKVMLLSIPNKEEMYKKCVQLSEDKENPRLVHPSRLVDCLVGINSRSKNEYMAIGGPWSSSLDGTDPVGDPSVLIKTAIRTCRALTGIDLSNVTRWYRFVEIHYHRAKTTYKGKDVPARVETVVIYAPDVWSVMPSGLEWDGLHLNYQKAAAAIRGEAAKDVTPEDSAPAEDEKDDGSIPIKEPTHWSKIDLKSIKVSELREECAARNISPKGLRLQLIARLSKLLKLEQEAEEEKAKQTVEIEKERAAEKKEEERKGKDKDEKDKDKDSKHKDKAALADKYKLPDTPHIIVHPCKKAKGGKFGCKVINLSLLLDYNQDVSKEHSFEVALFAENFNEMLMRDFGVQIYKALVEIPEKEEEKENKEDKEKDKEDDDGKPSEKRKRTDKEDGEEKKKSDEGAAKDDEKDKVNGKDDDETMTFIFAELKVVLGLLYEQGVEDSSKSPENAEEKLNGTVKKTLLARPSVTVNSRFREIDRYFAGDDKKKRKRTEKKREKFRTIRPELLLAFSYFDVTHFGKIANTDLEELIQTLGLDLARSQIKRLVTKVSSDSFINYRKLTDEPIPETDEVKECETSMQESEGDEPHGVPCEQGNKPLLPNFVLTPVTPEKKSATTKRATRKAAGKEEEKSEPIPAGFVTYNGALLNVANFQQQLSKNEAARLRAEEKAVDLKREVGELKDKIDHLKSDLRSTKKDLSNSQKKMDGVNHRLDKEMVSSDIYLTTLMDIHERLIPILDTDEIKRLVALRQETIGAPSINLVPLTKVSDIVIDTDDMKSIKEEPMDFDSKDSKSSRSSSRKGNNHSKDGRNDSRKTSRQDSPRDEYKKDENKAEIKKEEDKKDESKVEPKSDAKKTKEDEKPKQ